MSEQQLVTDMLFFKQIKSLLLLLLILLVLGSIILLKGSRK